MVRVWLRPATRRAQCAFERFLFFQIAVGLVIFAAAPHHRHDHVLPLIPSLAILAGGEVSRWTRKWHRLDLLLTGGVIAGLFLGAAFTHDLMVRSEEKIVVGTRDTLALADRIRDRVGGSFPLIHHASRSGLQFFLNTHFDEVSAEQAIAALASDAAAFVVTRDASRVRAAAEARGASVTLLDQVRIRDETLALLGNRPRLDTYDSMVTYCDGIRVRLDGVHLREARQDLLLLRAMRPTGSVTVTNETIVARWVELQLENIGEQAPSRQPMLAPGESFTWTFGEQLAGRDEIVFGQLADCRGARLQLAQMAASGDLADLDFLIVNGDFVFEQGWEYDLFEQDMEAFGVPVIPVCGNHDIIKNRRFVYEEFLNRFGYLAQAFEAGPVRFVLLESGLKVVGAEQFEFLDRALSEPDPPPESIVFIHVTPEKWRAAAREARPRSRVLEDEPAKFLSLLASRGCTKFFSGHENRYEHRHHLVGGVDVVNTISGGGGEKTGEKTYEQHWLKVLVTKSGVSEEVHLIPQTSFAVYQAFGLFVLLRYFLVIRVLGFLAPVVVVAAIAALAWRLGLGGASRRAA
jgi:hypothetical protein